MSASEQDKARELAGRIARRLESAGGGTRAAESSATSNGEIGALRQTLAEIQQRLAHIESHITHDENCAGDSPGRARDEARARERVPSLPAGSRPAFMSGTYIPAVAHPSQERFGIGEAVSELVDYFENEKTCELEPGGKPCDHCSMCSSRGF